MRDPHITHAYLAETHAEGVWPVRGPRRKHSNTPLQKRRRDLRRKRVAAAVRAHAGVRPRVLLVCVKMKRPEDPPTFRVEIFGEGQA